MGRLACLVLAGCVGLCGCSGPESSAADDTGASADWTVLFDGASLNGWNAVGDADWQLADGAVQADSGNGYLVSADSYSDFELRLEFWVSGDANSGVFIRCAGPAQIDPESCYEINIFDTRPDPTYRTGAIVDVAPPQSVIETGGHWNTYQIAARGTHLTVTLNGMVTVDVEDARRSSGPVALQHGAGTVIFRNVQLRRL